MGYRFASASLTGPAKNPWKQSCWTCGSSSGSGAIVAAALAAFAIGTETWGSIVCPSAYCGVTGLRPTFGRVSRYGAMALSFSMDKIGPMGRAADDCALVLSAIAAHDPRDRGSLPPGEADFAYAHAPQSRSRPLRIGWLTNAWKNPDKGIAAVAEAALQVLRQAGAQVNEARLPEGPFEDAANVIISVEGASAFASLIESGRVAELDDPLGKIAGYANEQLSASDYLRAVRVRGILQKKMDALFEGFDVLAAASLPIAATPLETNLETDLSFPDPLGGIGNLCGLPVISVPCGFSEAKLPVGLQFAGRVRNDRAVIAAAHLFQRLTDWHTRRPPVA
jgi:aspartyl-tRNA(Asn)/glutamyl-tRNA(Gln) amidotransferase subunit A